MIASEPVVQTGGNSSAIYSASQPRLPRWLIVANLIGIAGTVLLLALMVAFAYVPALFRGPLAPLQEAVRWFWGSPALSLLSAGLMWRRTRGIALSVIGGLITGTVAAIVVLG